MDLGLEGRVAVVSGGTSGLGLAVGRALAENGVAVALAGRRKDLAELEAAKFGRGIGVELDLRDGSSVEAALDVVRRELGEIDIVIANGGGPAPSFAAELEVGAARDDAELLLYGPMQLVVSCLSSMRARKWGRIVALGSVAVPQPISGLTTSSMFRAALASYLKLLAEEVALDGVTVNMAHPGRIATQRLIDLDTARAERSGTTVEQARAASEATIPLGRYGTAEEFASAVAYLCSEGARYVTGEQLRVDGGLVRSL